MAMQARRPAQAEFTVPTLDCDACGRITQAAVRRVDGLDPAVEVDLPARRLRLWYDASRLDEEQVREALLDAGVPVEEA